MGAAYRVSRRGPAPEPKRPAAVNKIGILGLHDRTYHIRTMKTRPKTPLDADIAAYEKMQDSLEAEHLFKWIVFHKAQFVGAYDTFARAAYDATQRFGDDPFLIRQAGEMVPARLSSHAQFGFPVD